MFAIQTLVELEIPRPKMGASYQVEEDISIYAAITAG